MYGIILYQAYEYFRLYSKDTRRLKCLVCSPVLYVTSWKIVYQGFLGLRFAVSSERSLASTVLTLAQVSWTRCTSLGVLTYGNGQHQSISIEPLCSSHQSYFYLVTNYFNPAALLIGTWYFIRAFLHRVMCLDVPHLSGLPWCAQLFLQHLTNLSYPGGHLAHGGGNGTSITFGRRHF